MAMGQEKEGRSGHRYEIRFFPTTSFDPLSPPSWVGRREGRSCYPSCNFSGMRSLLLVVPMAVNDISGHDYHITLPIYGNPPFINGQQSSLYPQHSCYSSPKVSSVHQKIAFTSIQANPMKQLS